MYVGVICTMLWIVSARAMLQIRRFAAVGSDESECWVLMSILVHTDVADDMISRPCWMDSAGT